MTAGLPGASSAPGWGPTLLRVVRLWAASTAPAVAVAPWLRRLFPAMPDAGWSVARPVGLVLWALPCWWLASWTAIPYGSVLAFGVLSALMVAGLWRARSDWPRLRPLVPRLAASEAVFLVVLVACIFVMPFNGELHPMAERFMDFAFFKRVSITRAFPPVDPWMSGTTMPYYYFGFVLMDLVRRAAASTVARFFDLAVALCYASFVSAAFGVGLVLWRRFRPAVITAAVVALGGNLHVWVDAISRHHLASVDWYGSARVIPGAITEFPLFSFVHGDLHAYTMAFPVAAAALALAVAIVRDRRPSRPRWPAVLVLALVVGALVPLHTWDVPTYGIVAAVCVAWAARRRAGAAGTKAARAGVALGVGAAVLAVAIAAGLPFLLAAGRGVTGRRLGLVHLHSAIGPWLAMWAPLLVPIVVWCVASRRAGVSRWLALCAVATAVVGPLLEWLLHVHLAPVLAGLLLAALVARGLPRAPTARDVSRLFAIAGLMLVLGVEFVYVRDLRGGLFVRMTTVFKAYVQAWILLAIGAAGLSIDLWRRTRGERRRISMAVIGVAAVGAAGFLVLGAPVAYAETLAQVGGPRTLDALTLFDARFPGDAAAAQWIETHLPTGAVVLERPSYAHRWPGRMATVTGRPTILGWLAHEALWRNGWTEARARYRDAMRIYRTPDLAAALTLLHRYHVGYVYVGGLELAAFGGPASPSLEKFAAWPVVYENPAARLYRVPP